MARHHAGVGGLDHPAGRATRMECRSALTTSRRTPFSSTNHRRACHLVARKRQAEKQEAAGAKKKSRRSAQNWQMLRDVDFKPGPYEAVEGADLLLILTEWDQFRALDLARIKDLMRAPVVVDLRNIYRPAEMRDAGFRYISVGRAEVPAA